MPKGVNEQSKKTDAQHSHSPAGTAATTSGAEAIGKTETAGREGEDLLQHAKQTTSKVVDQVQQQAGSRISRQKDNAAMELQKVADAVRQMGDGLGSDEQGPIAQYAADYGRKAADNLERFINYLRVNDTKQLVTEVENFGRRRPALLLGGAFLLGFAGARFLKSSTQSANEPSSYPSQLGSLTNTSTTSTPVPGL